MRLLLLYVSLLLLVFSYTVECHFGQIMNLSPYGKLKSTDKRIPEYDELDLIDEPELVAANVTCPDIALAPPCIAAPITKKYLKTHGPMHFQLLGKWRGSGTVYILNATTGAFVSSSNIIDNWVIKFHKCGGYFLFQDTLQVYYPNGTFCCNGSGNFTTFLQPPAGSTQPKAPEFCNTVAETAQSTIGGREIELPMAQYVYIAYTYILATGQTVGKCYYEFFPETDCVKKHWDADCYYLYPSPGITSDEYVQTYHIRLFAV